MNAVRVVSLLVHTVGLFAYGAITFLSWREYLQGGWDGGRRASQRRCQPMTLVGSLFMLSIFVWYALNLVQVLARLTPGSDRWVYQTVSLVLTFLFPAMIMHTGYQEAVAKTGRRSRGWQAPVYVAYALGAGFGAFSWLGFWGHLGLRPGLVGAIATPALGAMFLATGVYSTLLVHWARGRREETAEERSWRRWSVALYGVLGLLFVPMLLSMFGWFSFLEFVTAVLVPMIPMSFLFVGTYLEDRFEFFDLWVKRGIFLLLTAVLLTAVFAVLLPVLDGLEVGWARPWVFGIALLPLGLLLPWLWHKVGQVLDSVWLGRRFTTVEAVKHFLAATQGATSEAELVRRAEEGLEAIFHSPARIDLELPAPPDDQDGSLQVPIRSAAGEPGAIRLGRRRDRMPFFSEDVGLLASLGQVLSSLLENVRLQQRKQEQERQAKELSLHASRSELKALRAQINPHFLFNALNAIAGLLHKDPALADRTIEELAEVFRYTLRRSENEWTRLEDEMEFVRAYLEVEKARFGDRFRFSVEVEEGAEPLLIPTMMLQTLVENAVKHGAASVRGPARVAVTGRVSGGRLVLEVADNGPGFPEDGPRGPSRKGGYGLHNVEQRLRGYFGADAGLTRRRDQERGHTVVAITMPCSRQGREPGRAPGRRAGRKAG